MATLKPRITITLEPHVHEVLRRLSAAGGESMSAIVTSFLDVAVPPMERMVVIMEQAKTLPAETMEEVRGSILRAEAKLLPSVMALIDQSDLFFSEVGEVTGPREAGAKRTELAARKALPPVPVTRGVGRTKQAKPGVNHE